MFYKIFLIKDKSDVISRLCYKLAEITVMSVDMIVRATVTNVTIYIFDRLMVCGEKKSVPLYCNTRYLFRLTFFSVSPSWDLLLFPLKVNKHWEGSDHLVTCWTNDTWIFVWECLWSGQLTSPVKMTSVQYIVSHIMCGQWQWWPGLRWQLRPLW